MQRKADAFGAYGEAAVLDLLLRVLPEVVEAAAAPIGAIDKLTVISTDGASSLTKSVAVERGPGSAARHRPHRRRPDPAAGPAVRRVSDGPPTRQRPASRPRPSPAEAGRQADRGRAACQRASERPGGT